MKKKSITFIRAILLIISLILLLSSYITYRGQKIDNNYSENFKRDLITTVQKESSLKMKDLTPFEWDRIFVIRPYISKSEMHQIVGIKWTTANSYIGYLLFDKTWAGEHPLDDDIFHKLVFVKGEKVILDVTLERTTVDFLQV